MMILALPVLSLGADAEQNAFSCVDLSSFVSSDTDRANLDNFVAGGDIVQDSPVFFDIPRWDMSSSLPQILCLENIPIPHSVRGVFCLGSANADDTASAEYWGNCWLAVGTHAAADDKTEACSDQGESGDLGSCFDCVCTGTDFGTGQPNRTVINSCGIGHGDKWSVSCPDVQNGRGFKSIGGPSNVSSVQISICPESSNNCDDVCNIGGSQAPFRVGLQWVTDVTEQCFRSPFSGAVSRVSNWVATVTGSVCVVVALLVLY